MSNHEEYKKPIELKEVSNKEEKNILRQIDSTGMETPKRTPVENEPSGNHI